MAAAQIVAPLRRPRREAAVARRRRQRQRRRIIDVHGLVIDDPVALEARDRPMGRASSACGLFARHRASVCLLGTAGGRAHSDVLTTWRPPAAGKARNLGPARFVQHTGRTARGQTQLFVRKAATGTRQEEEEGTEGKGQGRSQARHERARAMPRRAKVVRPAEAPADPRRWGRPEAESGVGATHAPPLRAGRAAQETRRIDGVEQIGLDRKRRSGDRCRQQLGAERGGSDPARAETAQTKSPGARAMKRGWSHRPGGRRRTAKGVRNDLGRNGTDDRQAVGARPKRWPTRPDRVAGGSAASPSSAASRSALNAASAVRKSDRRRPTTSSCRTTAVPAIGGST